MRVLAIWEFISSKKTYLKLFSVILFGLLLSGCKEELFSDISESQANEMIMVLGEQGIDASRARTDDGKFNLSIERSKFADAMLILKANGLPGNTYQSLGEVFKSDKIISTPFEERARFMYALNQEMAQSITQIHGVVSSRVHITIPEETPFANFKSDAKASVFIYYDPKVDIVQYIPVIKNLLTKSVDGLVYENVTVALFDSVSADQGANASFKKKESKNYLPLIIFLIISSGAFFVLSRLIWKPLQNEPKTEFLEDAKPKES